MVEVLIEEMSRWDCSRSKDYERAVVVDAEVKEEQRRPLFRVNGEVRSKSVDRADIVRDFRFALIGTYGSSLG